jgi:GTP-binding protein
MAQALPRAEVLERLPVVALVGRPNTGKSTLFNRLTRSRRAVAASVSGVTRDRNIAPAAHAGHRFLIVDTGGFDADDRAEIARAVRAQSLLAAREADAVVVVVDGRAGPSPLDADLLDRLRGLRKGLFIAVNKIDTTKQAGLVDAFYELGVDALYPISAEHGVNVEELMDGVVASLPTPTLTDGSSRDRTAVAIVGRPNVGKSSLLNRLVGEERSIVTPEPGTTRDAVDTLLVRNDREYLLVDTAGVRRRPQVHEYVERASVVRALRALEHAEVGLLVVDAVEGVTEQDARIGGYAWERGRALGLVVNKWDAVPVERHNASRVARSADERFPTFRVLPKLFVSALTGEGVNRVLKLVDELAAAHRLRMPTPMLNRVLMKAVQRQQPPIVKGRRPRFLYATQTAVSPPTVTVFTGAPEHVQPVYERYLVNQLREAFPLEGTPVRFVFRARRSVSKKRG